MQLYQTASIYAASVLKLDRAEVGTMFTLNGALVVLLQLPAIQYIQRLGTRRALIAGTLGYAVSYAAVGLAVGQLTLLACIAAVTLAEIITSPAQQAAITGAGPARKNRRVHRAFTVCARWRGSPSGPLIGTTLLASLPPRAAWFGARLCSACCACLGYRQLVGAIGTYTSLWRPKPSRDVSSSAPAPWEAPESQVPRFSPSFGTALQYENSQIGAKAALGGVSGDWVWVDFVNVSTKTPVNHHRERLSEKE